jgi:hypothetical protein
LELMGYDQKQVEDIYGTGLTTANSGPFAFNYKFNARLGRAPSWKEIDLAKIAYPPDSDYAVAPVNKAGSRTGRATGTK